MTRFPEVEFRQYERHQAEILDGLRQARLDVALTYDLDIPADLDFLPLVTLRPYPLFAPTTRWPGAQKSRRRRRRIRWCCSTFRFPPTISWRSPRPHGLRPKVVERTREMGVMRAMVANGFGYSIANIRPQSDVAPDGQRLAHVPLTMADPLRLGLVMTEGARAALTIRAFIDHCRASVTEESLRRERDVIRALIVAHGQPSDPGPAAAELDRLAERVAAHLPGWRVGAATLAEAGPAAEAAGVPGVILPLFMAGGRFTRVSIPDQHVAGATGWQLLEPFGCLPALHDLTLRIARESGAGRVLLAAHGSFKSKVPSAIANHVAARITAETGLPAAAAFIDQAPQLETATGYAEDTVCLPFFAMAGGHVTEDIRQPLARAGFRGRILPPVGQDAHLPEADRRCRHGRCGDLR